MSDVKTILRLALAQFEDWLRSPRIIAGLLLGLTFVWRVSDNTIVYAKEIREVANIFDPYIFMSGDVYLFLFMAFFLVISDAPFIGQRTPYVVLRTGKQKWAAGMVLYVILSAMLFHLIMLLASLLFMAKDSFASPYWSEVAYSVSMEPSILTKDFSLAFALGADIMPRFTTIEVVWQSYLLQVLYSAAIGLIAFAVNLNTKKFMGSAAAIGVHILGYFIERSIISANKFISPFSQINFTMHNFTGRYPYLPTLNYSYLMLGLLLFSLSVVSVYIAGKTELKLSAEDKKL